MSKKRFLKWGVSILVIGILSYGGYYFYFSKTSSPSGETLGQDIFTQAFVGDLIDSIKVMGETQLLNEQKLKFNIEGNIQKVLVQEGDQVKTGDILAILDTEELQNELKEAQINLENAQISYKNELDKLSGVEKQKEKLSLESQLRKIDTSEYDLKKQKEDDEIALKDKEKDIQTLKNSLDKLTKESQISKNKLSQDLLKSKDDLEYKKNTLEDRKWSIEKQITDEKRDLDKSIQDYQKLFDDTYDEIENHVSGYTRNYKDVNNLLGFDRSSSGEKKASIYFSAKDSQYKNKAENSYWSLKYNTQKLENELKKIKDSPKNLENISNLLLLEKEIYSDLNVLGDSLSKGADESIESSDFTLQDISTIGSLGEGLKSSGYAGKSTIDDTIQKLKDASLPTELERISKIKVGDLEKSLQDLSKELEDLEIEYSDLANLLPEKIQEIDDEIIKTKRSLEQSQREYDDMAYRNKNSQKDREFDLITQKQDYEVALKNFNKKYNNILETPEVKSADNAVKQAQIAIDQVNKKIENYSLIAPFDGVIDFINYKIGDKLSNNSNEEKYIHLIDPSILEIKIKLDQIDILKVKKGSEAQVFFDAYPEQTFTGVIQMIDSNPVDENGAKKYIVKMQVNKGDLPIFSGMSASVDIISNKLEGVILIPTMSIESDIETGETYVMVKRNGKKVKQEVEIGMASDGNTQILSGIEEGDEVLEINFDANQFEVEDFMGGGMYY